LESVEQHLYELRDGRTNPTLTRLNQLKPFFDPYTNWPVSEFGSDELKAVQDSLVEYRYFYAKHDNEPIGYTRDSINRMINSIRTMWQWGIGREVTTEAQRQRLKDVRPLRAGRTLARDRPKRATVTLEEFNKVTEKLTSVVADMLHVIWATAMRPSEVCRMRPFDISQDDPDCWLYVPGSDASHVGDHKMAHLHRIRAIPLTSEVQGILKARIKNLRSKACIFNPAESLKEVVDRRSNARKTPLSCGNRSGTNRKEHPMIKPGEEYTSRSLRAALKRACRRAGVERFTPYDLRRSAATRIRSKLGKEAAKLILGHVSTDTTEIYLLDEVKETMKVAKQLDASREAEGVEAEEAKKPKKPKKLKKRKKSRTPKKKV
jgi:integrase